MEDHDTQPAVLDPDAMARLKFEKVQDEWNRKSCVTQGLATKLKPLPAKLNNLAADDYYASMRCNSILHIVTEEQSFHEDGIGLMLLKLERLLSLACLTGRSLVIPTATYAVLSRLIQLPALEAAGFCFVPANGPWKANAAKAWTTATRSRVNGLPGKLDLNSPMEAPATEPGLPLSHLADLITTDEYKASAVVQVSAARTLTTCSSTHDERLFYSKLVPLPQVLEEVQDFTFLFMTQHPMGKHPWLSHEEFRSTAKAQHIGAPGSGHFTAVNPAPDADECRENAFQHFHSYKGAAERVAELCFPSAAAVLMAKTHVARSLPEATFVPRGAGDKWREAFNAALANFSDAANYDGKGHSIQPALSYDPFQGEQLLRRKTGTRNEQMAYNMCKKQQNHDKSSVKAGACEAKRAAFLPSMDKKLESIAEHVNFWLLTVANTFIGSAADPTSVVAANIRVAKGAAKTVLEWETPDQKTKDSAWRNAAGAFQTPDHIVHVHKHGSKGVEAFWRCEKICYWCGPERRSRC